MYQKAYDNLMKAALLDGVNRADADKAIRAYLAARAKFEQFRRSQ